MKIVVDDNHNVITCKVYRDMLDGDKRNCAVLLYNCDKTTKEKVRNLLAGALRKLL